MHKVVDMDEEMEEFKKQLQIFLDSMTQEEFDQMLDEFGNSTGKPGPMFKSREDFERQKAGKQKLIMVDTDSQIELYRRNLTDV